MKTPTDYRISRADVAAVKGDQLVEVAIDATNRAWPGSSARGKKRFLRQLTPGQRAFLLTNYLVAEIYNGGIHQYFWNSTGNDAAEALVGLKLLGAKDHAAILRRAMRLFPSDEVLSNRRLRQTVLRKIDPEKTCKKFDEPFYDLNNRKRTSLNRLQQAYLKAHPDEFFLPDNTVDESARSKAVGRRDYRLSSRHQGRYSGEKLHWELIKGFWDDYWTALKGSRPDAEDFAASLSTGQRALIALDILNKDMSLGGFGQFISCQVGGDFLIGEVADAYRLLGLTKLADWFDRSVTASGDIANHSRSCSEAAGEYERVVRRDGEAAAVQLNASRAELLRSFVRRRRELSDTWSELSDEFNALMADPATGTLAKVEAYLGGNPDEFFKPHPASK
jgi:hypothetical protein